MANITHFLPCYSTKYKLKITYFCHANLEKFVYNLKIKLIKHSNYSNIIEQLYNI